MHNSAERICSAEFVFVCYSPSLDSYCSFGVIFPHQKMCGAVLRAKIAGAVKIQYFGIALCFFPNLFYYLYSQFSPSLYL